MTGLGAAVRGAHILLAWLLAFTVVMALTPPAAGAAATARGAVSGTVTAGGVALANVSVTLIPVTAADLETGNQQVALTDASGRYGFADVADRRAKVLVSAPAFSAFVDTYHPDAATFDQAASIDLSAGEVVADVALAAAGSATGQVVDLATRTPIEGARVTTWLDQGSAAREVGRATTTAEPGGFLVTGLPPTMVDVRITLADRSPYLDVPYALGARTSGVLIDGSGHSTGVLIGLRRGALITGTVRDDTGAAVAGATIEVTGCEPQCPLPATSEASGRYRIPGIRPGPSLGVQAWRGDDLLRVSFPARDDAAGAADLTLAHGDVLDSVDLTLIRAAFLTVEVQDTPGDRPLGAIVRLRTEGTTYHQYFAREAEDTSAEQGAANAVLLRVGPVPPGRYSLRVTPASATPGYLPRRWTTASGPAEPGNVRLLPGEQAWAVAGLIRDAAAAPDPQNGASPREPAMSGQWPGLASGFLAGQDRRSPFAAGDAGPAAQPAEVADA